MTARSSSPDRDFAVALARAAGGALIFGLPLLMTMEMWSLGFYMDPGRHALFLIVVLPLLVGISSISGFEETTSWRDDVLDAFVAFGVGFIVSAIILMLFGVLRRETSFEEAVGMITLQAVPASIGALLARSQLGTRPDERDDERTEGGGYFTELLVMIAGALFLAFNLAPTEEIVLIAYKMTAWQVVGLGLLSIILVDAFVYSLGFRGGHQRPADVTFGSALVRFGIAGYAIALLVSAYVLWTFGRLDGLGAEQLVKAVMVLGFPSVVGAAAARLIL